MSKKRDAKEVKDCKEQNMQSSVKETDCNKSDSMKDCK